MQDVKPISAHDEGDEKVEVMEKERVDEEVLKYAREEAVYIDEETSSRLKKMIDRRILVVMVCTYFLQAIDKGTLSFASIMGIQKDLGLHGQQYSWLTTCTYLAVLVAEFPTNWIVQRVPVAKYLGFNIMAWGTVLACHAATSNFAGIATVRTLLGLFEAVCQPTFVLLSAMWYKREEQASTVSFWYMMNGGQQIVGGILAYCFTLITDAKLEGWQILFLVYGCISVVWGVFVIYWMPDSPMKAKCFSEDDKRLMVERVRENQTGLQNKKFRKDHLIEALKDPQTLSYFFIQFLTALPTSGLGAFANIIISSFGFSVLHTQLLAMVLGAYLIIVLLSSAWLSKKFPNHNLIIMIGYVIPSIVGTVVLMTVKNDGSTSRRAALLFCYYIALSFWGTANLGLSMLSRNVAGSTKKSIVIAFNFVGWAVGNTVGPQVFRATDAPRYITAFATHMGCYAALILLLIFLRFWLMKENARKEKMVSEGLAHEDFALSHAFEDLTDRENVTFRYSY